MSSRQFQRWREQLDSVTGGVPTRAPGPKDIFRQRIQAASDANQTAIANRNDAVRRKLEEIRNAAQRQTQKESEES